MISKNQAGSERTSDKAILPQLPEFIKNSPVGAHLYEWTKGQLIFRGANVAAERILQLDHCELIGKTIEEAFPALKKTDIPALYKEIAKKGTTWDSDEVPYQDGHTTRYYKVNAFQTSPGNMIAMFTDITEIKNYELTLMSKNAELIAAEEELREKNERLILLNELLQQQHDEVKNTYNLLQESEEKFRTAFKTSPDSVNINRLVDGMYIEINEGFTQLTGFTWGDVQGKTSSDINIWFDPADRKKLVEALLSTGKAINLEAKFRLKNGDIRTGLISASMIKIQSEQCILSVTRDIEEIVQARASLKESEVRFRQLAENMDDVFWLSEGEKVLYVNSALERKFGINRAEIIEDINGLERMIHPDDKEAYRDLAEMKYLKKPESLSRQLRFIDHRGEVKWIWVRLFPINDDHNRFYRIAGIASDITQQKEVENELRLAKEKAQESDQLKSAFLANLSHEIRTPMNGILGFSRLLTNEDTDSAMKNQYMDIITKSSDQLLHIIDDLVDISKIEARQMRIIRQECNINTLINGLYMFFLQYLNQEKKDQITLMKEVSLPDEESIVLTDEFRLRQVLMNLLNNATKFTERGEIRFGYTLEEAGWLRFFVKDTGIGIEEGHAELIFEPFRQVDSNITRDFGGTGLGLSISRGLVKLLGGTIWLNSKSGRGSTFYFTIPYQTVRMSTLQDKEIITGKNKFQWQGKSVLIVEDDELNFRYLKEVLAGTGLSTSQAPDGITAIEEISRLNPDLVIMDIRLPRMNGLEATRKIRESGNMVPIIAQTAYAMTDDKKTCLEAGCNDYIAKPLQREDLLSKIAYYLQA
jgi:PAS domain S-box-containing protein